MMAERSQFAKHPIDVRVQIHYHGRHFLAARGRSLSRAGMYLEVRNLTLPSGTEVELELEWHGRPWRLAAVVVHRSPAGVGVRFAEEQPELDLSLADGAPEPVPAAPLMPPPRARGRGRAAPRVLLARSGD